MKRVLFTSTSGSGHLLPMLPVASAAIDAGWQVLFAGPPEVRSTVTDRSIPFVGLDNTVPGDDPRRGQVFAQFSTTPPEDLGNLVLREIFGRLNTTGTLDSMQSVAREFQPDVVVSDLYEGAGPIIADLRQIPLVRLNPGAAHPQRLDMAFAEGISELRAGLQLGADAMPQLRSAPQLAYWPESIDDEAYIEADTLRIRDPRHEPGQAARDENLIFLTLGSEAAAILPNFHEIMQALVNAVVANNKRAIVSLGPHGRPDDIDAPDDFTVEKWLDAGNALRQCSAVVNHGGAGSIIGALATNTPMIVLPLFADQPVNAEIIGRNKVAPVLENNADLEAQASQAIASILAEPYPRLEELSHEIARHSPPSAAIDLLDNLTV